MYSLPMMAVRDVQATATWYCQLLRCKRDHVAEDFDRLRDGDRVLLLLHRWDADEHGAWREPNGCPIGNGFVFWVVVDDFDGIVRRAAELRAEILVAPHENAEDRTREFSLRDPNGYAVAVIEAN